MREYPASAATAPPADLGDTLDGLRLVEHCALESYTVVTRLPPPHRAPGAVVRDFLVARFPDPLLRLSPRRHRDFVAQLPDHGISDGAAYDALVAATAVADGADLITCDRRARSVYEAYGLRVHFL